MSSFSRSLVRLLCVCAIWAHAPVHAQEPAAAQAGSAQHLKGRWFLYWGYNRAAFSRSTIHFTGNDYDFKLRDLRAHDRPEPFSFGAYFAPKNIWIPQYNYRVGRFFTERWSFSLGLDHMKYVVDQGQTARMVGVVEPSRSARYAQGSESDVVISEDLLRFEHTDGLNLLSVDADHHHRLWYGSNGKNGLYLFKGLFAGVVIPKTDVRLFGEGINNKFHLSGFGYGAQLGAMAVLMDRLMLRVGVRGGQIALPWVLTTGKSSDRAAHQFYFVEGYGSVGVLIGK